MATNAELFLIQLSDEAFRAAFECATTAERQCLLVKAGLRLPVREAGLIFDAVAKGVGNEEYNRRLQCDQADDP